MIKVRNAEICMTEQTVKELMQAIEKAKKEVEFTRTKEPMDVLGDMSEEQFIEERKKRGEIRVKSRFSNIEYIISIEGGSNESQKSLDYKLV